MDLSDALGGPWPSSNQNNSGGGGAWPGQQPSNCVWPGGPSQPSAPAGWPGGPSQPSAPAGWPGGPSQPSQPSWPGGPSQPTQPSWPGGPTQPCQPSQPSWPGGPSQPTQPSQPSWPGGPSGPSQPSHPSGPAFPVAPQTNLTMPFNYKCPNGLQNKLITIGGTVKHNPNKFTIDFYSGKDIVFHFNPRFNDCGKQVIVRNSEIGKKWGCEERELRCFPFAPGRSFEMKIEVTRDCFKVTVNNSHLFDFKHRLHRPISCMNIYYDITLTKFNVENLH